ncbi:MAG: hypothetical protein AAGI34_01250 [Pseudomonadota bacterium]
MRKQIRRIAPLQAGIVYGTLLAAFSIVFGTLSLVLVGVFGIALGPEAFQGGDPALQTPQDAGALALGGVAGVLFGAVIALVAGFVFGVVLGWLYTLAAGVIGGIVVEVEDLR